MASKREIKYLNRDFSGLKNLLIDYTKTYFPNTFNDFSPSSPGMLFLETAAYVGDVLGFYLDNSIQETFIQYARQPQNIYTLAYQLGYKPKISKAAETEIDIYQQLPATTSGSVTIPDFNYVLKFNENTQLKTNDNSNTFFLIQDSIDFAYSSSIDPTEITVYQTSGGNPQYYLLKKKRKAISAQIKTLTFNIGAPESFQTLTINDSNILGVLDITDADGNKYFEVPYLGQETIFESIKNTNQNDPNTYNDTDAPYLLRLKKIARRFISRFSSTGTLNIQFGSGTTGDTDENIIPNPNNVGLGLPYEQVKLTTAFDPTNFLQTDTYGIAPSNTTLTVRYLVGGGVTSNINSNTLTVISNPSNVNFINNNITPSTADYIFNTIATNNPLAATGGADGDTLDEIRLNAASQFSSQQRNVTPNDYLVRTLSLPSKYGSIAKAYIEPQKLSNLQVGETPSNLDLYILGYDNNNNLSIVSDTIKQNLNTYLSQYRMINDSIRIKNGFIINIGIEFEIVVLPEYNNDEVLISCVNALKESFNTNKQQFNQPIILKDIFTLIGGIEGVQNIKDIKITNKAGISSGYSQYAYDIDGATQNNIIYPSLDPSIFEIKYPNSDIIGRVVPF